MITELKELSERLGKKSVTRSEFIRETGISGNQIYAHFDGWRELCELAGLKANMQNVRLDDDDIYSAMHETFIELGGITTRTRFGNAFKFSVDVFKKRGMTWSAALVAFRDWCYTNAPDFPYLEKLPRKDKSTKTPRTETQTRNGKRETFWEAETDQIYGDFLNFRGLQHAPVNEQGVVFLFGMVARELGFVVESIQTGYPDCEAKRRVAGNRWERVRIEFEFKSRNFLEHGHDPNGCELIICWEDNWPNSPLPMIELKKEICHLSSYA